jgi:hypothetical protein
MEEDVFLTPTMTQFRFVSATKPSPGHSLDEEGFKSQAEDEVDAERHWATA